jgi:hypothetical protein
MKTCGRCNAELPLTEFARYGSGHQSYCRACKKAYDAEWYQQNREKRRGKVKADRVAMAAWLDSLKEGRECADCGVAYPSYVMEWDHLPGARKTFVMADVRRSRFSRGRILREVEKCELVCANCHRERTFRRIKDGAA